MYEHVRKHAIENIWCSPTQDNLIILSANRITKREGERISFSCMGSRIKLPKTDRFYHIFQVGQAHPEIFGLLGKNPSWFVPEWKRFDEVMSILPLFADLYNETGIQIPLHLSYYMFTREKALIFAVDSKSNPYVDFKNEQIYLRVYTNAFYESLVGDALPVNTRTSGNLISNSSDILAIQSEITQLRLLDGEVLCFVNGLHTNDISAGTCTTGDIVEYKYDASVKSVFDFKVSGLKSFLSTIDHVRKYILHPSDRSGQIDFIDDVDAYVIKKNGSSFKGQYLQRNQLSSLRMLTHQDYALSVDLFENIANSLSGHLSPTPLDIREFYIRLYVRNSGLIRPLVYENQRIFELYKLSDSKIIQAMTGVGSNVDVWRAEALEASGYADLMSSTYRNINIGLVEKAYGYNALSKIVGESPLVLSLANGVGSPGVVSLPAAFINESTVYEYDENGHLLDFYYRTGQSYYVATSPLARLVEVVVGKGSWDAPAMVGEDLLDIPSDDSYRVYLCYKDGLGEPSNQWQDITGSDKYTVTAGKLHWVSPETEQVLMVRTDKAFLSYKLNLNLVAGTLYFDLTEQFPDGLKLMYIAMDDLCIWLNKRKLIKNLDYFVDFPRVHIVNKDYLVQPATGSAQEIIVRFMGLSKTMELREAEDYGFIEHGFLSNNQVHDIRDDKVLDIVVRGSTKHISGLLFSEQHSGISVVNALNGSPYQIKEVVTPLRDHSEEETYSLREKALVIDKEVRDYMSLRLPQPPRDAVSSIPSRYMLVSPFFAHITNDLSTGQFTAESIDKELSDNEVLELCRPYEPLLKFDPISEENHVDQRYVVIHPTGLFTPIGVTLVGYRFLQKVVSLYGRGLISLSPHVVISLGA